LWTLFIIGGCIICKRVSQNGGTQPPRPLLPKGVEWLSQPQRLYLRLNQPVDRLRKGRLP
jgi:hypothetical protein